MLLYDRILGFIWLFLGLGICGMSYHVDLGELSSPGPGLAPFLSGCLLMFLSAIYLAKSFFFTGHSWGGRSFWKGVRWDKSILVTAALLAYILVAPILGYILVTFFFLLFLGKVIEPQRWKIVLLVSIFSTVISYLVFCLWLKCQFPGGVLGF
jgi:hypothetical protein